MKVLIYNWADLNTSDGGGVNVYVKNIIPELIKRKIEVVFLNSGVKYTNDSKLRIEKIDSYIKGCR